MKILIASGGFKDVFTPIEFCTLIHDIIKDVKPEADIHKIPMVDGGEYSTEVLTDMGFKKIIVPDVVDPSGLKKSACYVQLNKDTAFIAASAIVKLSPESSKYMNPLHLTSYGYGQLIKHAIDNGFKKIYLGMGGTSTVDAGIGMAQALGLKFSGIDKEYLTGSDLQKISSITDESPGKYKDVKIEVLCDSGITLNQMYVPTKLKISNYFDKDREKIIKTLHDGILGYSKIISKYIDSQGLAREITNLEQQESLGNSGAIMLSLLPFFDIHLSSGIIFFYEKFNLKKLVEEADLIITGEGRLDESSMLGKTPIGISCLAKKFNKKVIYVVGDIDERYKMHFSSHITTDLPELFIEKGISAVVSCHPSYKDMPSDYQERMRYLKKHTPEILARELKKAI